MDNRLLDLLLFHRSEPLELSPFLTSLMAVTARQLEQELILHEIGKNVRGDTATTPVVQEDLLLKHPGPASVRFQLPNDDLLARNTRPITSRESNLGFTHNDVSNVNPKKPPPPSVAAATDAAQSPSPMEEFKSAATTTDTIADSARTPKAAGYPRGHHIGRGMLDDHAILQAVLPGASFATNRSTREPLVTINNDEFDESFSPRNPRPLSQEKPPKKTPKVQVDVHEIRWNEMFKILLAFKKEHGHCLVPQVYAPDPRFGRWVYTQRSRYNRGKLAPDRVRRLEEVGFAWRVTTRHDWESSYRELGEFFRLYGHARVPRKYEENPRLGSWVQTQR